MELTLVIEQLYVDKRSVDLMWPSWIPATEKFRQQSLYLCYQLYVFGPNYKAPISI